MLDYRPPAVAKPPATTTHVPDYLASLNAQQRLAVEHGVGPTANDRGPLLIIAGAGSGKTSTLACRAAHLIANGADPQRILLLTFSRRAAEALERRAAQFLQRIPGTTNAHASMLTWAGTFHSVGARLLREYAATIGLHESFSILDRPDAEDLLDLVRHDLGFDATKNRFPAKGACLSIYSRVVNG